MRNHYSKLLAWIDAGEEIAVSRRGKVVARLVPEAGRKPGRVDWKGSAAARLDRSRLPMLGAKDSSDLLRQSQGGFLERFTEKCSC